MRHLQVRPVFSSFGVATVAEAKFDGSRLLWLLTDASVFAGSDSCRSGSLQWTLGPLQLTIYLLGV